MSLKPSLTFAKDVVIPISMALYCRERKHGILCSLVSVLGFWPIKYMLNLASPCTSRTMLMHEINIIPFQLRINRIMMVWKSYSHASILSLFYTLGP